MENTYKELISNKDFFAAALLQVRVTIVGVEEELIVDYRDSVEKYTEFSVRIGGVYYQSHTNFFKVST